MKDTVTSLYIVVIGCGRLGAYLANSLSQAGHYVVVVDRNAASFKHLRSETFSGFCVEGDASEAKVLQDARIPQANLVIAATQEDNLNLMVALIAKKIHRIPHVMARVYDPQRENIYRELGLETVCPTLLGGGAFFQLVTRALAREPQGGTP